MEIRLGERGLNREEGRQEATAALQGKGLAEGRAVEATGDPWSMCPEVLQE